MQLLANNASGVAQTVDRGYTLGTIYLQPARSTNEKFLGESPQRPRVGNGSCRVELLYR